NRTIKKEQERMKLEIQRIQQEINSLTVKAAETAEEIQSRNINVVITGVKNNEEVCEVLTQIDISVKNEVLKVKQIATANEYKPFIVTFPTEEMRNSVLIKRKAAGKVVLESTKNSENPRTIYINEDIPKPMQILLRKTKGLKDIGYRFVDQGCQVVCPEN
ncbi:hypothetical protein HHI36_001702, partial [Cryptolaemus montrouzieri]